MANDPIATAPETSVPIITSAKKSRTKRGRPRKASVPALATTSSLTRTTRRMAAKVKTKATPAPRTTMLNKLVNVSVVLAVFVTALAIQRIVPTEQVTAPKVESLPVQPTVAAAPQETSAPAAPVTPAPPAAPEASAAAAPMVNTTPATTPAAVAQSQTAAPVATPAQPCVTPTPAPVTAQTPVATPTKKFAKHAKNVPTSGGYITSRADAHKTTLNSGGAEDLDSEVARQHYIATTKLAKSRAPATTPKAPSAERSPLASPAQQ